MSSSEEDAEVDHPICKMEHSSSDEVTDEQQQPVSSQTENIVERVDAEDQQEKKVEEMWQLKKTFSQQNLFIFENGLYTDCEFVVGAPPGEIKKFSLHRVLLSKASPVFDRMFYGDLAEKEEIRVTDIEPHIFSHLMKFIYSGKLDITTLDLEQVQDLCLAANKYMLISLKNSCVDQLEANIEPSTACKYFQFSTLLDLQSLKRKACRILLERTDEVFADDSFNFASQDVILEIVQEPKLHIDSESILISACISWATHEVARRDLTTDTDGFKEALGHILNHLRFFSLTTQELADLDEVLEHVFNVTERHAMFITISRTKFTNIPEEFCQVYTKREKYELAVPVFRIVEQHSFTKTLCQNECHILTYNGKKCKSCDTHTSKHYPYFCTLKIDKISGNDIYLCGFVLTDNNLAEINITVVRDNEEYIIYEAVEPNGKYVYFKNPSELYVQTSCTIIISSESGRCIESNANYCSQSGKNVYKDFSYAVNNSKGVTVSWILYKMA